MAQPQYGMFGPLPWEVQQMQDAQFENAAIQRAQLSPGQHNAVMSALGGRALGQGIAGAFGIEDPAVARSKQMQAISKEVRESGIDPSNFEQYYTKLGEGLAKAGLMREAASVADALQSYRDKQAALDTKKFDAETARIKAEAFRSSKLRSPIAQEIFKKNKEYAPASLQKYLDSITPEKPDGDMSVLEPYNENLGEWTPEGFTPDKRFVFTNKAGQAATMGPDGKPQLYNGPIEKSTKSNDTKIDVTLPSNQVTIEAPAPANSMSEVDAKLLGDAVGADMKRFLDKQSTVGKLQQATDEMGQLVKNNKLITGAGSGMRLELARFLNTIGAKGFSDSLNDSDYFNKFGVEQVLPLMKQLGGSDSNEELKTLLKAAPNLQWTPTVIKRALGAIQKEIDRVNAIDNKYREFRESGRTDITSFNFNTGEYLKNPTTYKKDQPKREVRIKDATPAQAEAAMTPNQPVPIPAQAPVGNPRFESAVSRYMKDKGVSREQAIKDLMAAKQGR